jgi:hypothetical protein
MANVMRVVSRAYGDRRMAVGDGEDDVEVWCSGSLRRGQ